jgi:putative DNA primase/helicase
MSIESYVAAEVAKIERARSRLNGTVRAEALVCAASIVERELEALWPDVLWIGKPTLFAGDPGLGKSLVTIDIAARVSRGEPWPCSTVRPKLGDVLILSAEDDPADVTNARLRAAGADLARIHYLSAFREVDTPSGFRRRSVQLDLDVEWIKAEIFKRELLPRLIIVDPLAAFMGTSDSHNNAEVRAVLAQLAELANELQAAICAVTHLNKGDTGSPLYRVSGSLAFVAAARAVYLIARDPQDANRRLFVACKSNYGPTAKSFAYTVSVADNDAPYVRWDDRPVLDAASMLLGEPTARQAAVAADVDKAVAWLHAELCEGPRPSAEIQGAAHLAEISERDLGRATQRMRIVKRPDGFGRPWVWELPTMSDASVLPKNL